jgi:urocanate hydratase
MATSDIQHEAMRVYCALVDLRPNLHPDWGGGLVLLCGPGCVSGGAAAAVSIAGGTTLAVDSDAAAMKAAMRAGYLDFVVNSLDEALRTLKNQVRLRRPLGVGLVADVDATLAEMVERGVQPDLQIVPSGCAMLHNLSLETLRERGMLYRLILGLEDNVDSRPIEPFLILSRKCHYEYFFSAVDAAKLAAIDAALLTLIADDDVVRRRWILQVQQYLREARGGGRWIWLSDEERELLGDLTS